MNDTSFCIQNLDYSVPHREEKGSMVNLLTKVTGYLDPGEMTALVRPPFVFDPC